MGDDVFERTSYASRTRSRVVIRATSVWTTGYQTERRGYTATTSTIRHVGEIVYRIAIESPEDLVVHHLDPSVAQSARFRSALRDTGMNINGFQTVFGFRRFM